VHRFAEIGHGSYCHYAVEFGCAELRAAAAKTRDSKVVQRATGVALVLEGHDRAFAAHAAGMDRQSLCDWVHRYNAQGLAGLTDRPRPGRPPRLSVAAQKKLAERVIAGADLKRDGVVRFRRADLRDWLMREFGVEMHERSVGKLLHRLNFRHLSVRPQHPQSDPAAQETFKKTSPRSFAHSSQPRRSA